MRKFREQPADKPPEEDLPPATGPRPPDAIDKLIAQHGPARICAILAPILTEERVARIDAVLAARLGSVVPVVEDVYEPHNGGAVIRSAEALGLQELHILETGVRFQALRGITRGCHRWMDLARWRDAVACTSALRARGFTIYATTPRGAIPLDAVDVSRPVAIVFGNEHAGLPDATIAACDGAVVLPMFGFTESFNLSVTAALATSQLAARRRAFLGASGDLDDARVAQLRARWYALKVRGAAGIIERAVSSRTHGDVAPEPQSP
ncbi:MAG TPA: RNA methyltransferase [Kofleriaceae bacterium]|nr:RNA methyltransferase [Kofleriaceae bacterium]